MIARHRSYGARRRRLEREESLDYWFGGGGAGDNRDGVEQVIKGLL